MLKESLEKFGLSEKEAEIYLILLELGKAKAQDVARKTKLPRSTIYSILEYLEKRGLVFSFDQAKIKYFTAQDPAKIVQEMNERILAIKTAFPELKQLYRTAKAKPQIRYYQGLSELKTMYQSILKLKGISAYDIIASEEEWLRMDPAFFADFKQQRARAGIRTRLILESSETALGRKAHQRETYSEVKIIPPALGWKFTAGCYIFPDRVIFIAYREERVALEMISAEVAGLMKTMFEFMWRSIG